MSQKREKLTPHQQERLAKLIRVVKEGMATSKQYHAALEVIQQTENRAWLVAQAVHEIHAEQLFKDTHNSFDAFCWEVLGASRQWAYQQIDWVKVSTRVDSPIPTEKHARQLNRLPEDFQKATYDKATDSGPVSAAELKRLVDEEVAKLSPKDQLRVINEMDQAIIDKASDEEARTAPREKTDKEKREHIEGLYHHLRKQVVLIYDDELQEVEESLELLAASLTKLRKIKPRRQQQGRLAA